MIVLMLKTAWSYVHSSGQNTGKWRTDGQTVRIIWLLQRSACEQCGRAV